MSGKPQVYSQYFLNPQVQEIMDSRRYIRLLLKLLEKYPQKSKIYRLIRNIYKSREDDILKDRLMLFLDEKLGVDSAEAQKFPWHCGFIVAAEVFELVKNIRADNVLLLFFVFLVFDMIIAEYYYMRRSYSFRISQIFASLTALFCLTVYLLWEIFFTEDGTGGFALMLVLWLICAAWLIVLGIWSAVAAIIDWRKRKKSKYT